MANSYLTFNETTTPANQTKFTYSAWIKRSKLGSDQTIFYNYKDSNNYAYMYFRSADDIRYFDRVGGGDTAIFVTTRLFRDTSAWYHLVLQVDTTQGTAGDRIKFYVNGVQETFASSTIPNQNQALSLPREGTRTIGASNGGSNHFDGYQSHVAFVDSTSPAYTTFGSTDATSGIWKFKPPSGVTWGNTGFHLKFENSAALGTDSSGNSSTFTVQGNLKQALDTPSNVYATLNSLPKSGVSFSYGNLQADNQSNDWTSALATFGSSTGKWYAEFKVTDDASGTTRNMFGVCDARDVQTMSEDELGQNTSGRVGDTVGYSGNGSGNCLKNGSDQGSGFNTTYTIGDIISVALDCTNGAVYIAKNGTYLNSGSPTSGASKTGAVTITTGETYLIGGTVYSSTYQANYGNGFFGTTAITSAGSNGNGSLFEYDVPSGYYALNTKNINTYG